MAGATSTAATASVMKMTNARMAHRKQHGALTTLLVSQ
eukprot:CAMPEP_0179924794 /NCGR_PEP_ID=MMETSP0983-20121128/6906_1 /TAXON_ID=483367 /ORGANISM="non described non described, Strain CCMP 2436" /LENGTH=37 /DNA_ID= /DNA_START= /DNA_END= /DNA_ORIENTATION=